MEHLWEILIKSNTFNFIILVLIFVFVFKKINIGEKFSELQKSIKKEIDESTTAKKNSQKALEVAQKNLKTVDSEVEKIITESKNTANIMAKQIIAQATPQIEIIKNNAQKVIENDIRKTKIALSSKIAEESLKLSENNLKTQLKENKNLHQIFIDEALTKLEEIKF